MTKRDFLDLLELRLKGKISKSELQSILEFYAQSVDERMEDGMSEQEAVQAIGSIDDIVSDILIDAPIASVLGKKIKTSREGTSNKTLWTVLAIAGFPVWLPVAIALAATIFVLYIAIWVLVISVYVVWGALIVALPAGVYVSAKFLMAGQIEPGIAFIFAGVAGLLAAIALFRPTMSLAKKTAVLTAKYVRKIKKVIKGKKEN